MTVVIGVVMVVGAACGGDAVAPTAGRSATDTSAVSEQLRVLPDGPFGSRLATTDEGCVAAGAVLDLAAQHLVLTARGADPVVLAEVAAGAERFRPSIPDGFREAVEDGEAVFAETAAALGEEHRRSRTSGRSIDVAAQRAMIEQMGVVFDALPVSDLMVVRCGFG